MAEFLPAYRRTMKYEGGDFAWSNNPKDPGRETVMGISRVHWPDDPVWAVVDAAKGRPDFPRNLKYTILPQLARDFYEKNFWNQMRLNEMGNQEVAEKAFDIAVNASIPTASKILQRALNVLNRRGKLWPEIKVDGVLGSITIETVGVCFANRRLKGLMTAIRVLHGMHYIGIMERDEKLEEFALGWLTRAME